MQLSDKAKNTFFSNLGKPVVGLIHTETNEIVLGACIPEKVSLQLNSNGEATSGTYITGGDSENNTLTAEQLERVNALLEQKHVPRAAYTSTSPDEKKTSHQFLYKQECQLTSPSKWRGFTLQVDASGRLNYTFVSGSFNSLRGTRKRGAELSWELAKEIRQQASGLGIKATDDDIQENPFQTPPRKLQCVDKTNTVHVGASHALFPPLAGVAKADASIASSDASLTMGLKK